MGSEYQDRMKKEMEELDRTRFTEGGRDSINYGWSGPGTRDTRETSRSNDKNEKLVFQAAFQLGTKYMEELLKHCGRYPAGYAIRKIAPFDNDFSSRSDPVAVAFNNAAIAQAQGNKEEEMKGYQRVEELCEPLLQDILNKLKALKIHNVGFVPGYLPSIYIYRSQCRVQLGNFQGAIDDATHAICLWWSLRNKGNETAQTSTILSLMTRGTAFRESGLLEKAVTDFRGCSAAIRAIGPSWQRKPSVEEATHNLLFTMAMIKHRDQAPRPHYAVQERESWQVELGIGIYERDRYRCGNCGAVRSSSVKLKICSRCKEKWFCSKDCMAHAWKYKGHKEECKQLQEGLIYKTDRETVAEVVASVKEKGIASLSGNKCVMYDAEKDEYYDSLSDRRLSFLEV